MKYATSLVMLILSIFFSASAQNDPDSLKIIVAGKAAVDVRLDACQKLVLYYIRTDSASAQNYIAEGMMLADQLSDIHAKLKLLAIRGYMFYRQGYLAEAIEVYKEAVAISEQNQLKDQAADNLFRLGELYDKVGRFEETIASFKQSLSLFESVGDKRYAARVLNSLGIAYGKRGSSLAISYFEKSLKLKIELGDKRSVSNTLTNIGLCYKDMGNYSEAISYFKRALAIATEADNQLNTAAISANIGSVYLIQGNYEEATHFYEESLRSFKVLKNEKRMADCLLALGQLQSAQGAYTNSIPLLKESLALYEESGEKPTIANALSEIGYSYLYLQAEDSAFKYFDRAFEIYREIEFHKEHRAKLLAIGKWYSMQGQLSGALKYNYDALRLAEEHQDTLGIASVFSSIADIHQTQQNFKEALAYQQKALDVYQSADYVSGIATVKNSIGTTLLKTGRYREALDHSRQALQYFEVLNDSCAFSLSLLTIGSSYRLTQQTDSALYYLKKAEKQAGKCKRYAVLAETTIETGQLYQSQQLASKAFDAYEQALRYAQISQNREVIKQAAKYLYPIYKEQGDLAKAFTTLEIFHASSDSLFNEANTRNLVQKEMEYAFEKEQREKAYAQRQKDMEQQNRLSQQRTLTYGVIGALFAAMVIAFAFYRNYRNKQKANVLLQRQKREIESKNEILRQQKQELEELDQVKSRFFANISHELRTPLTLISSPLQGLLAYNSENFETNTIQTLQLMQRNTVQLKGLVNDILELSKLEANAVDLHEEPTGIASLLRRITANFDSLARSRDIKYSVTISEELTDTWLLIDVAKTEKILNNLLSNAMKHTLAGDKVMLAARKDADRLLIRVADTGQGIPQTDLPHVFNRFYQSKQPDAFIQGSTGIGLALCKELTELLGGELSVTSQVGEGTSFSLSIPYRESEILYEEDYIMDSTEEEDVSLTHLNVMPVSSDEKKFNVLIVEDHPDMQRFIENLLVHQHTTYLASNGKQALKILEREKNIDLIISDVMMPEMDGIELLKTIKGSADHRGIPVIMLTALSNEADKLEALTIGVDDYLTKPFSPEELLARVHNLLIRHEVRKQAKYEQVEKGDIPQQAEGTTGSKTLGQPHSDWVNEVANVMLKELENPEFNLTDLASQFHLSERQFRRNLKKLTGLSPKQYQQEIALTQARKLLENGTYQNISAISYSIGIRNVSRFSQLYEARFGKNPKEYFGAAVG